MANISNQNQVTERNTSTQVHVVHSDAGTVVVPRRETETVTVSAPGPQGIQGVQGLQGASAPFTDLGSGVWNTTSSIQVTGSFTVSGSSTFTNIGPAVFSGSVTINGAPAVTTATLASLTASSARTASYLNTLNQDLIFNGNLTLNGTASISYLNVQYESASVIYSSGSNQLGDAANDTQTLYGSVIVPTGSLTVSGIVSSGNSLNTSGGSTVQGELRSYQLSTVPIYLSLQTTSGKSGLFRSNTDYILYYDTSTGDTVLNSSFGGAALKFNLQNSEKMRILSNGNVGIGTTIPSASLHVKGATTSSLSSSLLIENSSSIYSFRIKDNGDLAATSNYITISSYDTTITGGNGVAINGATFNPGYIHRSGTTSGFLTLANDSTVTSGITLFGSTHATSPNLVKVIARSGIQITGSLTISGSTPSLQLGTSVNVGDFTNPTVTLGSTSNGFYLDSSRILFKANGVFAGGFSSDGYIANQVQILGSGPNNLTTAMFIPYRLNAIGLLAGLGGNDTGAVTLITSGSTRLYVSSSGNVGIGTTTPITTLDVSGSIRIVTTPSAGNVVRPDNVGTAFQFGNGTNTSYGEYRFKSDGGTDLGRFLNTGNFGIGTITPTASLHISASNSSSAYSFLVQNSSGQVLFSSQNDRTVNINSTNATNGNTTIGTTNGTITFNQGYNNTFVGNALTFYNGGVASTIQGFTTNPGIAVGYAQTTTNPNTGSVFTVKGTATTSGSGVLFVTGSSATKLLRVSSEANANILVVSGSGNIGVGVASPQMPMDVLGAIRSQNGAIYTTNVYSNAASNTYLGLNGTTSAVLGLHNANMPFTIGVTTGAEIMRISGSGDVGIGTSAPTARLHISGSSNSGLLEIDSPALSDILYVSGSGNIGIGTRTPAYNLEVVGSNTNTARFYGGGGTAVVGIGVNGTLQSSGGQFRLYGNSSVPLSLGSYGVWGDLWIINGNVGIGQGTTAPTLTSRFTIKGSGATSSTTALRVENTNASASMVVLDNGNIGIGTTTPAYKLDVSGSTRFKFSPSGADLFAIDGATTTRYFIVENSNGFVGIGNGYTTSATPATSVDIRGNTSIRGGSATVGNAFIVTNTTPTTLLTVQNNGQVEFTSPTITLASTQSAFRISPIISASNTIGGQYYGVNITPTFFQTTGSQTETAFRVAATFSQSSAAATAGTNIIADFGSTSAGSQLTVTDVTSGSIYMVNDVSGLPIIEATSNWDVNIYDFPNKIFEKTGSQVNIYGTMRVSGSFVLPLSQSAAPQIGSAYWSGSLLFIYNGTRYMSSSFA